MRIAVLALAAVGVVGMLAPGCNAPPRGEQNRRVDISDTTKAERRSAQVQPTALVEFSDQAAQQLVQDLVGLPEFNSGQRVNVVFGDIVNKTGIVPTSDFEAFRSRTRSKLLTSSVARGKVRWIENRARMDELRRREAGSDPGKSEELNWAATYFLNGEMYNVSRVEGQAVYMYLLNWTLTHADSRELIWQNSYEVKQAPGN
jgi:hypothetical protein